MTMPAAALPVVPGRLEQELLPVAAVKQVEQFAA
jgi:hypothetical protein